MNKIARAAGYYIDIFEDRTNQTVYITVGPAFSKEQKISKYIVSINNGLIKLEMIDDDDDVRRDLAKIRDVDDIIDGDNEWDILVQIYKDTIEQLKEHYNIYNDDIINYYEPESGDCNDE